MEKTKKCSRICEAVKPQEVQNAEGTLVNPRSLDLQTFEKYLRNRAMVTEFLQRHYTETTTNHLTTHPLHRKLKLSKYIRRQKASEDMVAKLKSKFGNDAIFVVGNYSAPNTRYQEPARGVGFRRLLKKHGFLVYLIDEFQTSQCYPPCENRSPTAFKRIPNPWPYQRQNNPEAICHGLLACTNQNCKVTVQNISGAEELCELLWNRDLAACLNLIHIVRNLRLNGEISEKFQRARDERSGPTRRRRRRRRPEENAERQVLPRTL
ncbi:hypothetical protein G6F66_007333 [Rhizopus arrhizus]|nr:hypothetical protein G6F23_003526 [Rhizopus arrhizus]KAG1292021.1 hypothetical protein G6F66_007333 [Rhizopus arrhizus]